MFVEYKGNKCIQLIWCKKSHFLTKLTAYLKLQHILCPKILKCPFVCSSIHLSHLFMLSTSFKLNCAFYGIYILFISGLS